LRAKTELVIAWREFSFLMIVPKFLKQPFV
jgi:hypothetical protein